MNMDIEVPGGGRGDTLFTTPSLTRGATKFRMRTSYVSVEKIQLENKLNQFKVEANSNCVENDLSDSFKFGAHGVVGYKQPAKVNDDHEQIEFDKQILLNNCELKNTGFDNVNINGTEELELEVCGVQVDEDDGISEVNTVTNNVLDTLESRSNNTFQMETVRESRATRRMSKLSDKTLGEPTRRPPSSRISHFKYGSTPRSKSNTPKFVSVKTGKVFEKHPCLFCEKVFASEKGLKLHTVGHLPSRVSKTAIPANKELRTKLNCSSGTSLLHCTICGKEFSQMKCLKKHSQTVHVHTRPYMCSLEMCDRTFTRLSHLTNHRQSHPDSRNLECVKCFMRFSSQEVLEFHQKLSNCGKFSQVPIQGNIQLFHCEHCPKTFRSLTYLNLHQSYHAEQTDLALQCPVSSCKERISSRYKLERHMESHSSSVQSGVLVCSEEGCSERFSDPGELKLHLEEHIILEKCSWCELKFDSKLELLIHRFICTERKDVVFSCRTCNKTFKAKRFVDNHSKFCGRQLSVESFNPKKGDQCAKLLLTNEETKSTGLLQSEDIVNTTFQVSVKGITKTNGSSSLVKCDFNGCDERFCTYLLLRNHLYSHTDNPYHCSYGCQASFSQLANYQEHCQKEHCGNFELLNCDKCEEVFTVENHREKLHVKGIDLDLFDDSIFFDAEVSVTGPFHCKHTDCKASFPLRSQLRVHYMSHDPLDTTCAECNQRFSDRNSLTQHRVDHHTHLIPPLKCPFCEDSFLSTQYLSEHLLSVHPPPWSCPYTHCNFSPSFLLEASLHMQMHQIKICDWPNCEQQFQTKEGLMNHFQEHTFTLWSCPIQTCSFICCAPAKFDEHLEEHKEEKVFNCYPCNYYSYNMRQLECHLESGHRQRPKPHEFTSEVNLPCSVSGCPASFVQENFLMKHIRNVHGQVDVKSLPDKEIAKSVEKETGMDVDTTPCWVNDGKDLSNQIPLDVRINSTEREQPLHKTSSDIEMVNGYDDVNRSNNSSPTETPCNIPEVDNTLVCNLSPERSPGPPLAFSETKEIYSSVVTMEVTDQELVEASLDNVPIGPLLSEIDDHDMDDAEEKHNVGASINENEKTISALDASDDTVMEEVAFDAVMEEVAHSKGATINENEKTNSALDDSVDADMDEVPKAIVEQNDEKSQDLYRGTVYFPVRDSTEIKVVDDDEIHPVIPTVNLTHDAIDVCDNAKDSIIDNEDTKSKTEHIVNCVANPSSWATALSDDQLKKASLNSLYSRVVSDNNLCPTPGQFTRLLDIDRNMLDNTVVPELLEPVDESSLCKGLAIDLLELQLKTGVSQDLLAAYIRELLPVNDRPADLDSAVVEHMVRRLNKMRIQASRFRARYKDFPMYLNEYLVELCNPFL